MNQEWFFQRDENGSYRIANRALGEDFSLDVVNDGVFETLIMAPSSDVSGQIWQATLLDNGYRRLTNSFSLLHIMGSSFGGPERWVVISAQTSPSLTLRQCFLLQ